MFHRESAHDWLWQCTDTPNVLTAIITWWEALTLEGNTETGVCLRQGKWSSDYALSRDHLQVVQWARAASFQEAVQC